MQPGQKEVHIIVTVSACSQAEAEQLVNDSLDLSDATVVHQLSPACQMCN